MEQGKIAELDTPLNLWKKTNGIFRGMCDRSGIRLEDIRGAREEMELFQSGKVASASGDESSEVESSKPAEG